MSPQEATILHDKVDAIGHDISCLALLLRFSGSSAANGGPWDSKDASALGAAVVWAATKIEDLTDRLSEVTA